MPGDAGFSIKLPASSCALSKSSTFFLISGVSAHTLSKKALRSAADLNLHYGVENSFDAGGIFSAIGIYSNIFVAAGFSLRVGRNLKVAATIEDALLQVLIQPGTRESPVPVGGPYRDVQGLGGFGDGQPSEVTQLDHLRGLFFFLGQFLQ